MTRIVFLSESLNIFLMTQGIAMSLENSVLSYRQKW